MNFTAREFKFLGGAMLAEMGVCAFQPRPSKMLDRMVEEGVLCKHEEVDCKDPRFSVRFTHYTFTQRGMLLYCEDCDKRESKEVE